MDPELSRRDWSPEEDMMLVAKQGELGNQWAQIKQFLPGRSILAVKNRFLWLARREVPRHSLEFRQIVASHEVARHSQELEQSVVPPAEEVQAEELETPWGLGSLDSLDVWVESDVFSMFT
jgi:hypothetical protein